MEAPVAFIISGDILSMNTTFLLSLVADSVVLKSQKDLTTCSTTLLLHLKSYSTNVGLSNSKRLHKWPSSLALKAPGPVPGQNLRIRVRVRVKRLGLGLGSKV